MNPREQLADSRVSVLVCESVCGVQCWEDVEEEEYFLRKVCILGGTIPPGRKGCTFWAWRLADSQSQEIEGGNKGIPRRRW